MSKSKGGSSILAQELAKLSVPFGLVLAQQSLTNYLSSSNHRLQNQVVKGKSVVKGKPAAKGKPVAKGKPAAKQSSSKKTGGHGSGQSHNPNTLVTHPHNQLTL